MTITKRFFWIFPILLFALLWQLGAWGVTDTSEARYAEISREMLTTGNWLMPDLLGIFHFDKPLLVYWLTSLGLEIFGINAFGARFFLQIAYLIQIYLVYRIVLELFCNRQKAIFSALIYAGFPIVLISIRALTIDAYLNTLELASVLFLTLYFKQRKAGMFYFYFLFLGLCVFAKGPVGMILPVLMIYPIRKLLQVQGFKNGWHVGLGIVLTLIIGGWWFVYLLMKSPDFYNFLIGEQLVNRMMKAKELKRSEPFWYYLAYLPAALIPSVFLIPQAIRQNIRGKANGINLLTLFGVLIPLLFFSTSSSKLLLYVLPLTPFVAMICGYFADEAREELFGTWLIISKAFFALLFTVLLILYLGFIPGFSYQPTIMAWIFWGIGVIVLFFMKEKDKKQHFIALSLMFPVFIAPISAEIMSQSELVINSTAPVARFIKDNKLDQNRKVIVWNYRLSSLSYELQKDLYSVKWEHYSLFRHTEFQNNNDWKKNLIDVKNSQEAVYLRTLVDSPSVLVTKDEIPRDYSWIMAPYHHSKNLGKWTVYY